MTAHVELETLAALADGELSPDLAARAQSHLATCSSCTAAYSEAVRYRATWLLRPESLPAVEPAALRGVQVAFASEPRSAVIRPRRLPPAPPLGLAAAVAAAVLVTAGAQYLAWRRPPVGRLPLPPSVQRAMESESARGLVMPGGEIGANGPITSMRSGLTTASPELQRSVDALVHEYESGSRSNETAARLIAGLVATGDFDAAGDYLREALRRSPADARLLVLAGAVCFRQNDLAGAEAALRSALARAPRDPLVELDLAMVLRHSGATGEAERRLRHLASGSPAPIAARAARELNEIR